jgi:hypothetical protein
VSGRDRARRVHHARPQRRIVTHLQDLAWVLLVGLLLPLWIFLALVALAVVVGRPLYIWVRGKTTLRSRSPRQRHLRRVAAPSQPPTPGGERLSSPRGLSLS